MFIGKIYVQDLIYDLRHTLAPLILEKRAYIYICGDAKSMAHAVEEQLKIMLGEAKGGTAAVEGAKEFKLLKDRSVSPAYPNTYLIALTGCSAVQRLLLDVWS